MKRISLLVSTVDLNLLNNPHFFDHINFELCEVIIVQQLINSNEELKLKHKVRVITMKDKGLSKSRNQALLNATCPIAIICDDDIQFKRGFEQIVLAAYEKHPEAALINFKIENEEGLPYKIYAKDSFKHGFRSILRVNSMGITLQLNQFKKRKLFNEYFGLGTDCPGGEDTIFAVETYKSKMACYFIPESIIIHPLESSGKTFNKDYPLHLGKIYKKAFGGLGLIFGILFSFKKYPLYKKELGLFAFISLFLKGYFST